MLVISVSLVHRVQKVARLLRGPRLGGVVGRSHVDEEFSFVNTKLMRSRDNIKFDKGPPMVFTSIIGLCVGGILAQHFRALVLVPTSMLGILSAWVVGLLIGQAAFQIFFELLAITITIQIGYFVGLAAKQLSASRDKARLKAVWPH